MSRKLVFLLFFFMRSKDFSLQYYLLVGIFLLHNPVTTTQGYLM